MGAQNDAREPTMRWKIVAWLLFGGLALAPPMATAETAPSSQPNPQTKPGGTIVVNPTQDECKRGWNAQMRWTKDQFEAFCARLGASK
jgi:hypothetical protein